MQAEDRDFFKKGVIKRRLKDIDAFIPPRSLLAKMALRRKIPNNGDYISLVTKERFDQIALVKEERTATQFEIDDPVAAGQREMQRRTSRIQKLNSEIEAGAFEKTASRQSNGSNADPIWQPDSIPGSVEVEEINPPRGPPPPQDTPPPPPP